MVHSCAITHHCSTPLQRITAHYCSTPRTTTAHALLHVPWYPLESKHDLRVRFFSSHLQKDPEFRSTIIGKKALAIHMCAITFTCFVV
jgi:hypothetical protein